MCRLNFSLEHEHMAILLSDSQQWKYFPKVNNMVEYKASQRKFTTTHNNFKSLIKHPEQHNRNALSPSWVADSYQEWLQASSTNTTNHHNFSGVFRPRSHVARETSQDVTHPGITPQLARLTVMFLRMGYQKEGASLVI